MKCFLQTPEETERFGAELWASMPERYVVFLEGELGMGKTTLVRGFLKAGGFKGSIKSPTYALVEEYQIGSRKILHFDLYRLADPEELEWIGIDDYFADAGICFIEWPDKGRGFLPVPDAIINIENEGQGRRLTMKFKPFD
jgi:tRNA threonylcarbamoyladenosine biosynthesis protein TsaE